MTIEGVARVLYDAMRRFNREAGNNHYVPWADASEEDRNMFIEGVKLHLANPTWTGRDTHNYWMDDRIKNGWTYGPVRNGTKKTHPSLVDFDELSLFEQAKDNLVVNIVAALRPLVTETE